MLDHRLKAVRQRTLTVFDEELARTNDYDRALGIALDTHNEKARPFAAHIGRELDAMQDEIETQRPRPPKTVPAKRPPAAPPPQKTTPAAPAVTVMTGSANAVITITATATGTIPQPPSPADRSAKMDDKLKQARADTVQDYERLLRRGGDAIGEALDNHYDRVERLRLDVDDELDAMQAILRAHKPSGSGQNSGGQSAGGQNARTLQHDSGNQPRPPVIEGLLTSPFRFVALNDTVVGPEQARPDLRRPLPGGYRAVIRVDWVAETPLLIGDSDKKDKAAQSDDAPSAPVRPMKLGDDYVIPGATIRGCLRSAMEIVAAARLNQINTHAVYGLRDFDHPAIKPRDEDQSLLAVKNVKAGWLERRADGYWIAPCADWHLIRIADLPIEQREKGRYRTQYDLRAAWLAKTIPQRYASVAPQWAPGKDTDTERTVDFATIFKNGARQFTLDRLRSDGKKILISGQGKGSITGHLVFSNKSPAAHTAAQIEARERQGGPGQAKKYEYVFETGRGPAFKVDDKAWNRFLDINSRMFKNKRRGDGSWGILEQSLIKEGDKIPVFYVGAGATLQIGVTRFFKVQHGYTIGQIRDRDIAHRRPPGTDARDFPIDFVEALFGYVFEPDEVFKSPPDSAGPGDIARRGRIACGFARLPEKQAAISPIIPTVMGAPRASFAPFYLRGRYKDYSSNETDTRLAGRKRYLPRFPDGADLDAVKTQLKEQIDRIERESRKPLSPKVQSRLSFLVPAEGAPPLKFTGDIRLDNVSAAEIGAVLWVLTFGGAPESPYRHMMGRARPFGAGQMRVDALTLTLVPNDGSGRKDAAWQRGKHDDAVAPFLDAFQAHMRQYRPQWPHTPDVAEFLATCNPREWVKPAADNKLNYPALKNFNEIRKYCKLSTRFTPPDGRRPRYLPALEGARNPVEKK